MEDGTALCVYKKNVKRVRAVLSIVPVRYLSEFTIAGYVIFG